MSVFAGETPSCHGQVIRIQFHSRLELTLGLVTPTIGVAGHSIESGGTTCGEDLLTIVYAAGLKASIRWGGYFESRKGWLVEQLVDRLRQAKAWQDHDRFPVFDTELMKYAREQMFVEANVDFWYHVQATDPGQTLRDPLSLSVAKVDQGTAVRRPLYFRHPRGPRVLPRDGNMHGHGPSRRSGGGHGGRARRFARRN